MFTTLVLLNQRTINCLASVKLLMKSIMKKEEEDVDVEEVAVEVADVAETTAENVVADKLPQ